MSTLTDLQETYVDDNGNNKRTLQYLFKSGDEIQEYGGVCVSILDFVRDRSLFDPQNKRLIMYLIVGVFGLAINQAVFLLMYDGIGISYVIAGLLGSGVSIFANYVMNDSWTWKNTGAAGVIQWFWRAVKYGTTRVVGVGIGAVSQIVFVELIMIDPAMSNILKVGVGVLWGFGASEKWVWHSDESSLAESNALATNQD